jgi:ankyrin repeat protein
LQHMESARLEGLSIDHIVLAVPEQFHTLKTLRLSTMGITPLHLASIFENTPALIELCCNVLISPRSEGWAASSLDSIPPATDFVSSQNWKYSASQSGSKTNRLTMRSSTHSSSRSRAGFRHTDLTTACPYAHSYCFPLTAPTYLVQSSSGTWRA